MSLKQQQNKDSNISLNSKTIALHLSFEQKSALSTNVHYKWILPMSNIGSIQFLVYHTFSNIFSIHDNSSISSSIPVNPLQLFRLMHIKDYILLVYTLLMFATWFVALK